MKLCPQCRATFEHDLFVCPTDGEMLVPDQPPVVGTVFDGLYFIEKLLGKGGMGSVYLARHVLLKDRVAIKVLSHGAGADPDWMARFVREGQATRAVRHPNAVKVHDLRLSHEGVLYMVLEYVEGKTLRAVLDERIRLTVSEVVAILEPVASALDAAHARGVVHRDVKPENIMIGSVDGGPAGVKLLDLGIAKLKEIASPTLHTGRNITLPGQVVGTPSYIPPEQWGDLPSDGEAAFDGRADVYSLGVVAYEMTAGYKPIVGRTIPEFMEAHRKFMPALLSDVRQDVPRDFALAVARALAKDRAGRQSTSGRFVADLRASLEAARLDATGDTMSLAGPASSPEPTPEMTARALAPRRLEPEGGAVPLDSRFYVVRPVDGQFGEAIARGDSIVLVKGARQMGKTSLLARGLQQARALGVRVTLTDFQDLSATDLTSSEALFLTLGETIAEQLDLDVAPRDVWKPGTGANRNFGRYMRQEVLERLGCRVVWALDEVDRLFAYDFASEVFGLFRSWHNKRSLDPDGPWRHLTLAIAYATEAHLFISDVNQSPFNVGTRLALDDFTIEQVEELNRRYSSPLRTPEEIARLYALVGGHPFLVRCSLHALALGTTLDDFEARADHEDGPFGDHLRRLLVLLAKDPALGEVVRGVLRGEPCPTAESFYRLRSAGIVSGDSAQTARMRCHLYAAFLKRQLL